MAITKMLFVAAAVWNCYIAVTTPDAGFVLQYRDTPLKINKRGVSFLHYCETPPSEPQLGGVLNAATAWTVAPGVANTFTRSILVRAFSYHGRRADLPLPIGSKQRTQPRLPQRAKSKKIWGKRE
jgi:hypothetical protein